MAKSLLKKVFGSRNERLIHNMHRAIGHINSLEPQMQALSDEALKAKTAEFR